MLRRGFKAIRDIIGDPIASPTRAQLEAICDVIFQERDEAHRTELLRYAAHLLAPEDEGREASMLDALTRQIRQLGTRQRQRLEDPQNDLEHIITEGHLREDPHSKLCELLEDPPCGIVTRAQLDAACRVIAAFDNPADRRALRTYALGLCFPRFRDYDEAYLTAKRLKLGVRWARATRDLE